MKKVTRVLSHDQLTMVKQFKFPGSGRIIDKEGEYYLSHKCPLCRKRLETKFPTGVDELSFHLIKLFETRDGGIKYLSTKCLDCGELRIVFKEPVVREHLSTIKAVRFETYWPNEAEVNSVVPALEQVNARQLKPDLLSEDQASYLQENLLTLDDIQELSKKFGSPYLLALAIATIIKLRLVSLGPSVTETRVRAGIARLVSASGDGVDPKIINALKDDAKYVEWKQYLRNLGYL